MSSSKPTQKPDRTMEAGGSVRLDKWLWYARFCKSRSLAAKLISGGGCRLNGERVAKPSQNVKPGDVLVFSTGRQMRTIQVDAPGTRRGPASEAQTLYTDLAPPLQRPKSDPEPPPPTGRPAGSGRPEKRDRRLIERLMRKR